MPVTFPKHSGKHDDPAFSGRNPHFVRSLRSPRPLSVGHRAYVSPSTLVAKTEPAFPHDVGRIATACMVRAVLQRHAASLHFDLHAVAEDVVPGAREGGVTNQGKEH